MYRTFGVRVTALCAAGLVLTAAFAQSKGGGSTGSTGTTGSGTTGSTGTTGTGTTGNTGIGRNPATTTPTTQQPTQSVTIQQPIFVSGKVQAEDGTVPSDQITIVTVCNGITHSEGYADSKGYFAIELGANRGVIQDASEYSASGMNSAFGTLNRSSGSSLSPAGDIERRYMGCDLQAKISGYRSQAVPLTNRRPMDDPNVGVILLHRLGAQEEGRMVSVTSLNAPKDAKKAYEKGMDAIKKQKFADAQNSFEKAVEIYPKYAAAWYELGRLRSSQDQFDIARGSYNEAIKADPKFVPPYMSLAILELQAKHWQQLVDATEQVVKLDPFDYPQAFFFNAVANFNIHNLEAAEKSGLQAEHLDTRNQFPQLHHVLGLILVDRKDWDGAAKRFKDYLRLAPKGPDVDLVRKQLAQVEKIQEQLASAKDR